MKKILYFLIILFLISGIISQSDELGSIASKPGTGKLDQTIPDTETSIGESIGLASDKNDDIKVKNVKVTRGDTDTTTKITANPGAIIKIKGNDGVVREYSLEKLDIKDSSGTTLTKEGQIILDKNGNIVEGYFTVGKTGKFKFGDDDEIELPKGTGVIIKNGVAQIALPADNSKVPTPTKITGKGEQKITFEFTSRDTKGLILENQERFQGVLKYSESKFYFDKDANIGALTIKNPNNVKTYLDFRGEVSTSYDSAYISMNREAGKIVIGQNGGIEGPAVMFNPDSTNPYGVWVENDDHFAVKALGEPKSSYLAISKRDSTGLVPRGEMVGGVAINEDNAGIYTQNNEFYKKTNGRVLTGLIADGKGTTTIPIELEVFNNVDGKLVPISKEGNKVVISNRLEIGYGPNPDNILGSAYDEKFPEISKKVSNRINYNYVEYTEEGFQEYTKLELTMDSYSREKMTPDKYRMLIDFMDLVTPSAKKIIKKVDLVQHTRNANNGAATLAWGGPGGIQFNMQRGALEPGIILHEATHAVNIGNNNFWNDWQTAGGVSETEVPSEWSEWVFQGEVLTSALQKKSSTRGKLAVLTKYGIITQDYFDYRMKQAGLESGKDAVTKYISEGRTGN